MDVCYNDFASKFVLSMDEEQDIINNRAYSPKDIMRYAQKFGTHHSIIVGRLQHHKKIPYSYDSQLLDKIDLFEN